MGHAIFSGVWLLISLIFLVEAYNMPVILQYGFTGPSTFPKVLSIFSIFISIGYFIHCLRNKKIVSEKISLGFRQLVLVVAFIIYIILLPYIGFFLGSSIFSVSMICFLAPSSERRAAFIPACVSTAIMLGIIYYIFVVQLQGYLP